MANETQDVVMTRAEYEKVGRDFRSVWTTERTDLKGWDEVREQYMGKRTLMHNDGKGLCLLIEGMGLTITD